MPTKAFFKQYPPFPADLEVYGVPRLSYAKLHDDDATESRRLLDASCEQGFFLLDMSDGPNGNNLLHDVEEAFRIGESFFETDLETKKEYKRDRSNVGYKPVGVIKNPDGTSDLAEICAVGRDALFNADDYLPKAFADRRDFLADLTKQLHEVAMAVLAHLAKHLHVPLAVLERPHDLSRSSSTVLRFLHYQRQTDGARQSSLTGHTDNGSLTVLFTAIGGLQVLPPDAKDAPENWRWVRPQPNCAIVNIGDSLVQWTGGVFRSGFHRVLYAPGAQAAYDRYSFGYFLKPADDAPMNRIRQGRIPSFEIGEENADQDVPKYEFWHGEKTKHLLRGHSSASRGGRGLPRQADAVA